MAKTRRSTQRKPLILLALFLSACSSAPKPSLQNPVATASVPDKSGDLVIVATTDFHAALDRAEGMASVIRELRTKYGERMIHLDGGDLFQGSLEGDLEKGKSVIAFYNLLGVNAVAMGNHDLDFGLSNLKARAREAKFPILSANFRSASGKPVFRSHAIFTKNHKKVCVIGATTPTAQHIVRKSSLGGAKFLALKEALTEHAIHLKQKEHCGFLILVTHAGLVCDPVDGNCLKAHPYAELLPLFSQLPDGLFDAVVAGHTHQKIQEVIPANSPWGTPVIEAGTGGRDVGVLHITNTAKAHRYRFEPFIPVPASAEAPDITAMLKPYREKAAALKAQIVGSTVAAFPKKFTESELGNLYADATLEKAKKLKKADIALLNGGGVRADLPVGTVTYGDVYKVIPFSDNLSVVELQGSELRRLLEIAFSGAHIQGLVSGAKIKKRAAPIERDLNGDGKQEPWERDSVAEITDLTGKPLEDKKLYRVATSEYLSEGGDHQDFVYAKVPKTRIHVLYNTPLREIVVDYLKAHPNLSPQQFFDPNQPRIDMMSVDNGGKSGLDSHKD